MYDHTWELGFLENTLEDIVSGAPLRYKKVFLPFSDRWFADPFILKVTTCEILLLCEEFCNEINRGRIAKVVIDRDTYKLKSWKIILELPTHLSFPVITRINGRILIYPENSASGLLNLYEFNSETDSVSLIKSIVQVPFTDAIITSFSNEIFLFATTKDNPNGKELTICKKKDGQFSIIQKVIFPENIARMAGNFFQVNGKVYRPAQECNHSYGHSIDIQSVEYSQGDFCFRSVRRIASPSKRMSLGFHTLNEYNGIIVVDTKGHKHPKIVKILTVLKSTFLKRT